MLRDELKEILSFLRREIEEDFPSQGFEEVSEIIDRLIDETQKRIPSATNSLAKKLLEREKELLEEIRVILHLIRLRKLMDNLMDEQAIERLSPRERTVARHIRALLLEREEKGEEGPSGFRLALVLKEIPSFVGVTGEQYGPFKPGDLIRIKEEDLRILISRGLVKVVGENENSRRD